MASWIAPVLFVIFIVLLILDYTFGETRVPADVGGMSQSLLMPG